MLTQRKKFYLIGICICIIVIILDQRRHGKSTKESIENETNTEIKTETPVISNSISENQQPTNNSTSQALNDFQTSYREFRLNYSRFEFKNSTQRGYEKFLIFDYHGADVTNAEVDPKELEATLPFNDNIIQKNGNYFFLPNEVKMVYIPTINKVVFTCINNSQNDLVSAFKVENKKISRKVKVPIYYDEETGQGTTYEERTINYNTFKKATNDCFTSVRSIDIKSDYFFISVRDSIHANLIISDYNKVIEYLKTQQVKE